jgi:hypothetical protein
MNNCYPSIRFILLPSIRWTKITLHLAGTVAEEPRGSEYDQHIAPQSGCVNVSSDRETGVQAPIFSIAGLFCITFCSRDVFEFFLKVADRALNANCERKRLRSVGHD